MNSSTDWKSLAQATLEGAESGRMDFGQAVGLLMQAGFDGYAVDYRRATRAYYLPDGTSLELSTTPTATVAQHFDVEAIKEAIRQAQTNTPGYTYHGFCEKTARAGCAGYLVSFVGKRVLYYGRTGETHTEFFPVPK